MASGHGRGFSWFGEMAAQGASVEVGDLYFCFLPGLDISKPKLKLTKAGTIE